MGRTRADIPSNYVDAWNLVGGDGRTKTVCNNTVAASNVPSEANGFASVVAIRLHGHTVVQFREDGAVRLDSCGYRTATTKDRINRCLRRLSHTPSQGGVFQKNFEWFFRSRQGLVTPFTDGIIVQNGEVVPNVDDTSWGGNMSSSALDFYHLPVVA